MGRLILVLFFLGTNCFASEIKQVQFAENLKQIVKTKNINELKIIKCVPTPEYCVDEDRINYIFTSDKAKEGKIYSLLKRPSIKTHFSESWVNDGLEYYIITYYDPSKVSLSDLSSLSEDKLFTLWQTAFIQTLVVVKNGVPHLSRTIFYIEAHLPFVGDYG